MKKRLFTLMLVTTLAMTGCGSSSKGIANSINDGFMAADSVASEAWDGGFNDYDYESSREESTVETSSSDVGQQYEQKLIRTYNYSFQTLEFDASMAYVEQQVAIYGGYIESSETSGSSSRYADLTIRIPEKKRDAFLNEVGEIGEIIYKSSSSEDITISYYDATARLESLNTQHERLLELLAQSSSLSDIVELEAHLADVEYEINRYTTMLRVYDNKVDYVTINFSIREVQQIQVVEDDTFWTQIKKGFTSNTSSVINGLMNFVIFLVTGIPYFIVIGVIVAIAIFVIKKIKKAAEKNATKRREQMNTYMQGNHVPPFVTQGQKENVPEKKDE